MDLRLVQVIPILLLTIILLMAAISDIRFWKIPNRLTFPALMAGLMYHTCTGGSKGLFFSIRGVFLGLALLMTFYILGGMGAGDVKLMGVVGGILGPKGVFAAFLCTAVIGGVYDIILLFLYGGIRNDLRDFVRRYGTMLKTFLFTFRMAYIPPANKRKRPALRYGVAIAIGTMISVFIKVI